MAESWRTTKKIIRNAIYKGDQLTVVIPLSPLTFETLNFVKGFLFLSHHQNFHFKFNRFEGNSQNQIFDSDLYK